jgi:hypothetical protein
MEQEKDFFTDLLENEIEDTDNEGDGDTEKESQKVQPKEETEDEAKRRKNKDAEEARKRREAEEKAQLEEEQKKKENASRTNKLGEQLILFKQTYPDVDLKVLDGDVHFKRYIDGKLLGKKNFTELYEEFVSFKDSVSTKSSQVTSNEVKANSSTGSQQSVGNNTGVDVYTEKELENIVRKLPLLSDKEARKVMEKFERSVLYYNKKGR